MCVDDLHLGDKAWGVAVVVVVEEVFVSRTLIRREADVAAPVAFVFVIIVVDIVRIKVHKNSRQERELVVSLAPVRVPAADGDEDRRERVSTSDEMRPSACRLFARSPPSC